MHTFRICLHIDQTIRIVFSYLGIKGVELQLICALEGLRVDLFKGYPVELALEDVDLFHVVIGAPDIFALSGKCQFCVLSALSNHILNINQPYIRFHLGGLVLLGVVKDKERNPKTMHIFQRKRVLGSRLLQIKVFDAVVVPETKKKHSNSHNISFQ